MRPDQMTDNSMIDMALRGLQEEREACVQRLCKVLEHSEHADEAHAYLKRIDNINAALVRLASSSLRPEERCWQNG